MFSSIRWRIASLFTLLFTIILIALALFVSNFLLEVQVEDQKALLTSQAQLIANALRAEAPREYADFELRLIAREWAELVDARVTLIAADGEVLAESSSPTSSHLNQSLFPEIVMASESGAGVAVRDVSVLDEEMVIAAVRYDFNSRPIGFVSVSVPFSDVAAVANTLRDRILAFTAVAGLVTLLLSIIVASQTTQPLETLTRQARAITEGNRDFAIQIGTRDEVAQLARAIQVMAEQLQNQVSESEIEQNKLAAILGQMRDAVVVADELGRIVLLNDAAEELFDTDQDNAVGRSLAQVLRRHDFVEAWRKFQSTGAEQIISVEIPQRNLFLQVVVSPFSDQLEGYTLLLFQDLTRIRHLETVRRDFISNISHELRTPLASLKALAETLQGGAIHDEAAAFRFLERIDIEVDALTQMVQELLELSRIESGQVPLQLQTAALSSIMASSVRRLQQQADRAGVHLVLHACDCNDHVAVDAPRMEQVFINLIHNAIKFTSVDGEIAISFLPDDDGVIVRVADTGIGIPQEDLHRIFERFYKTDRARAGGGTGLGLAIARHIVESHEGRIWAESREGSGSQFYVRMPLAG